MITSTNDAYGIGNFGIEKSHGKSTVAKTGKIYITVSEEELDEMRATARTMGFRDGGDYCLNCVRFCRKDGRIETIRYDIL